MVLNFITVCFRFVFLCFSSLLIFETKIVGLMLKHVLRISLASSKIPVHVPSNYVILYVWGTCVRYMCEAHVWGTCVRYMCEAHVWGTCVRYMREAHAWGTCVRHMCEVHVWGTCVRYMCLYVFLWYLMNMWGWREITCSKRTNHSNWMRQS